jgi:hypothetical protein
MTRPLGAAALPRLLARSAAGAAAGCAALHALVVPAGPAGWPAAGTVALAAACLVCAAHLWRRPRPAAWLAHAVGTTAMLTLHPLLAAGPHHGPGSGLAAWAELLAGVLAAVALALAAARALVGLRSGPGPQSACSPAGSGGRRVPQA